MNVRRSVEAIYRAPAAHMVGDGFRVAGYFNAVPDGLARLSPFLLLDYHAPHGYTATDRPRGVGVHPHRGFETVTIAWQGSVAHQDSSGGGGVVGPGDVQWMTAASGILHKEFHDADYARRGGPFHMAQLWVNLPRAHKMDAPGYQAIAAAQIPVVESGGTRVRVIAGEYDGVRGAARTFTRVTLLDATVHAGARLAIDGSAGDNLGVLVIAGVVRAGDRKAEAGELVLFANDGAIAELDASEDAHLLVLGGEPIREPIAAYGPFVMNTAEEVGQAFDDLRAGKLGQLED